MQCDGHAEGQVVNLELNRREKLWRLRPDYSPLVPLDGDTLLESNMSTACPLLGKVGVLLSFYVTKP